MTLLDADRLARRRALEPDRSFCVLAPAGSGKTELLTQRLLKLLSLCEQPEQILAITFTRKAAGEMRHRLLENLRKVQAGAAAGDASEHEQQTRALAQAVLQRDAEFDWHLLQQPNRLRIVTIDSFTSYLTARLPLAAGFGSRPELTTDVDDLFRQAVRGTLALLENSAVGTPLGLLLLHLHNNLQRAETLLLDLLKRRADWLPQLVQLSRDPASQRAWLEQCMRDVLLEQLQTTRSQLTPYQATLLELAQFAHRYLAAGGNSMLEPLATLTTLPAASPDAVGAWQALAELFLTRDGNFRRTVTKKQGFIAKGDCKDKDEQARVQAAKDSFKQIIEAMTADAVLPAWQALQLLPPSQYRDDSWPVLAALLNVLPLLAAQLQVAMRSAGIIDHVETSLASLQALGSDDQPTDLTLSLDYRLQHILVDEFQDTSHTQFALLEKLTAGWQAGDGRTLFIVGDGMQSCYGFRNADVSLFLRARDDGIGPVKLEPLQLTANFRCSAEVVDWVNTTFAAAFPPNDDLLRGGVRYTPCVASKAPAAGAGVACLLQVIDEGSEDDDDEDQPDSRTQRLQSRIREADAVAARCAELRAQQPDDTIAILVRNRKHLTRVVQALRQRQLKWTATDIDHLLAYQEIADLHTLLRALLNPADVTALYALLRSPLVGLDLRTLAELANAVKQQQTTLWSLLPQYAMLSLPVDAQTRLARCVPVLQNARQMRQQMPLREWLELCWLELGGGCTVQDAHTLANLAKYLDLVEAHTHFDDITDIHAFEQALEQCFGSDAGDPKLQIMTIHKAKGLQFDHVLLCGLDLRPRNDDPPLIRWQQVTQHQGHSRLLLAIKPQKGGLDEPLYDFLAEEKKQRDQYELTRLLYIGVTRAIKTARLYGTVKPGKDDAYKAGSGTLLHSVLPVLTAQADQLQVRFETVTTPANDTAQPVPTGPQQVPRLPAQWRSPLPAPLLRTPAAVEVDQAHDDADNLLARRIGELVHLGLKQVVERGDAWLAQSRELPLWRAQLGALCPAAELNQHLQVLLLHLHNWQRSAQGRWLFQTRHAQDRCELPLQDYRGGWRRFHVVDRTFVTGDGERWIVDYKTALPASGQNQQQFLSEQSERYRQQLQTYRELMAVADPATAGRCRIALYFTGLDQLHELT